MSKKETSWGGVAEWYDELVENSPDSYQTNVILPNLIRIADPKSGVEILDIACGQGYFSRSFAEKGASVTAFDISPELVEKAKQNSDRTIKYFVSEADRFTSCTSARLPLVDYFHVATVILAMQNIENYATTFNEAYRALKKGGRLIVVLNHPAFRIPLKSSWQWDDGRQYRRIDAYMSDSTAKIDMTPGETVEGKKKFTFSFHRPLQSYIKAMAKSSFSITRLEEWISQKKSQEGGRGKEEDRMRKEIPLFLCIEAVK